MEPDGSDGEGDLLRLLRVSLVELIVLELTEATSSTLEWAVGGGSLMLALPVVAVDASVINDLGHHFFFRLA